MRDENLYRASFSFCDTRGRTHRKNLPVKVLAGQTPLFVRRQATAVAAKFASLKTGVAVRQVEISGLVVHQVSA